MQAELWMPSARCGSTLLAVCLGILACSRGPELVIHAQNGQSVRVALELALTEDARMHGLMYRRSLPANTGMLFLFPESARHPFWMKNTPLPLDMIFIGEDLRVVGVVERTVPFSKAQVGVDEASRYVLELNAGFSAQHGIRPGDRVELRRVPAPPSGP